LESARLVKTRCPKFHLVLIGNGPDRNWLERAIAGESWIHYLGSCYGRDSALYYRIADLFLLTGTAGLAIVDSFAAGLPVIATALRTHPPEISYLRAGENGCIAAHDAIAVANAIIGVTSEPMVMETLRKGAQAAGSQYTMEAMVANFREGVNNCLAATRTRHRVADRSQGCLES
jgi:glycosyltransferase involved in cell wall biosynthesis